MVSRKKSEAERKAKGALVSMSRRSTPWGAIAAVLAVVLLAGGVFGYLFWRNRASNERTAAVAAFIPSAANQDPSTRIPGVVIATYKGGTHARPDQRVAYDRSPPMGGAHDQFWAACNGVVYPRAVRSETLVHSLEHGAVWIAYNPAQVSGAALNALTTRVEGKPYTVMSPYPGLDRPISLQSWGHQLKIDTVDDPRIDQFITALRSNRYTHPENGASCQTLGPGQFDQDNPPPFNPTPPGPPGPKVLAVTAPPPDRGGK